jgi:hypothetical protein
MKQTPSKALLAPPKRWWTFNGVHGVIAQKIELFVNGHCFYISSILGSASFMGAYVKFLTYAGRRVSYQ